MPFGMARFKKVIHERKKIETLKNVFTAHVGYVDRLCPLRLDW